MGTCKDCFWWGRDYVGACDRVGLSTDDRSNIHSQKGKDRFYISFGADDDQGSFARLHTGPEFGCTHFEQKKGRKS